MIDKMGLLPDSSILKSIFTFINNKHMRLCGFSKIWWWNVFY